jgi:DNA-binding IclR family transcriptional regulator
LRRYTSNTVVDPQALLQNLVEVRMQGYAICADELDPDVMSFACPIHLPSVGVLFSVGIVGLSRRFVLFERSEVVRALKEAADLIAPRLQGELKAIDGSNLYGQSL